MAKGICAGLNCRKVFSINQPGIDAKCNHCGYLNLREMAMVRYAALPGAAPQSPPTPDPIMDTASAPAFDSSKEGRKNGKIRMELVLNGMPNALLALGKCMTWAIESKGYEEYDFLTVPDGAKKYRGAMLRHDLKEILGEAVDDESGLIHATHTAWNAMARLELLLREGKQP